MSWGHHPFLLSLVTGKEPAKEVRATGLGGEEKTQQIQETMEVSLLV